MDAVDRKRYSEWSAVGPEEELPPRQIPWDSKPTCGYATTGAVAACHDEDIVNAALFVRGAGDAHEIDANDVGQRQVGDCHLLAPIIALANTAEGRARIQEMIRERRELGKTVYDVTFQVPSEAAARLRGAPAFQPKTVTVAPPFKQGQAALGDRDGNLRQEVWPKVLEAGYAKLRGSYPQINGGFPKDAFEAITGKPAIDEPLVDGWLGYSANDLARDAAAGKPISIWFGAQDKNPRTAPAMKVYDLHGVHAYALERIFEKGGVTYVQLANPWGPDRAPKKIPLRELVSLAPNVTVGQRP